MEMLERTRTQRSRKERARSATKPHEFLTHDQRDGGTRELEFIDLDDRERTIFLRCGFRAPQMA